MPGVPAVANQLAAGLTAKQVTVDGGFDADCPFCPLPICCRISRAADGAVVKNYVTSITMTTMFVTYVMVYH